MKERSFNEILSMVIDACNNNFFSGTRDVKETVLECATQIYISLMKGGEPNAR